MTTTPETDYTLAEPCAAPPLRTLGQHARAVLANGGE